MKTAKEARIEAENINAELNKTLLDKIEKLIATAVSKGEFSVNLTGMGHLQITVDIKRVIEKLGYKYDEFYDQRDDYSSRTISW